MPGDGATTGAGVGAGAGATTGAGAGAGAGSTTGAGAGVATVAAVRVTAGSTVGGAAVGAAATDRRGGSNRNGGGRRRGRRTLANFDHLRADHRRQSRRLDLQDPRNGGRAVAEIVNRGFRSRWVLRRRGRRGVNRRRRCFRRPGGEPNHRRGRHRRGERQGLGDGRRRGRGGGHDRNRGRVVGRPRNDARRRRRVSTMRMIGGGRPASALSDGSPGRGSATAEAGGTGVPSERCKTRHFRGILTRRRGQRGGLRRRLLRRRFGSFLTHIPRHGTDRRRLAGRRGKCRGALGSRCDRGRRRRIHRRRNLRNRQHVGSRAQQGVGGHRARRRGGCWFLRRGGRRGFGTGQRDDRRAIGRGAGGRGCLSLGRCRRRRGSNRRPRGFSEERVRRPSAA